MINRSSCGIKGAAVSKIPLRAGYIGRQILKINRLRCFTVIAVIGIIINGGLAIYIYIFADRILTPRKSADQFNGIDTDPGYIFGSGLNCVEVVPSPKFHKTFTGGGIDVLLKITGLPRQTLSKLLKEGVIPLTGIVF